MRLEQFDHLLGIPIHYARQPVADYGTIGKGPRLVRLDSKFKRTMVYCIKEIESYKHIHGGLKAIVSGGCYVNKAGMHGIGRGIDIDALWFNNQEPLITLKAPEDAKRYIGIEAILRSHLGTVLNYWYNSAHEDHWHCDDKTDPGWREGSRARIIFIQAALTSVFDTSIGAIDGVIGRKTTKALKEVLELPAGQALDLSTYWVQFLDKVKETALV